MYHMDVGDGNGDETLSIEVFHNVGNMLVSTILLIIINTSNTGDLGNN
jgi:hypothetical protein